MPTILFIPRTPLPARVSRSSSTKIPICPDCGTTIAPQAQACAGCGRLLGRSVPVISAEQRPVHVGLGPTGAGAWLVLAVLMVVVVGGPIFWWRTQYAEVPKPETEAQQKARLQSEAEGEMLKECTNIIVGLTRIIHSSVVDADDNPYQWGGDATLEYVNRVGGIERTNLFFKFGTDTGTDGLVHLRCSFESEPERRTRQRGDKHEFGRWVERAK